MTKKKKKTFYDYIWWWMLTKRTVVIILRYVFISNHYVVHLKLIRVRSQLYCELKECWIESQEFWFPVPDVSIKTGEGSYSLWASFPRRTLNMPFIQLVNKQLYLSLTWPPVHSWGRRVLERLNNLPKAKPLGCGRVRICTGFFS